MCARGTLRESKQQPHASLRCVPSPRSPCHAPTLHPQPPPPPQYAGRDTDRGAASRAQSRFAVSGLCYLCFGQLRLKMLESSGVPDNSCGGHQIERPHGWVTFNHESGRRRETQPVATLPTTYVPRPAIVACTWHLAHCARTSDPGTATGVAGHLTAAVCIFALREREVEGAGGAHTLRLQYAPV